MKTNTIVSIASIAIIGYVGYMVYNKMKKKKEEEAKMKAANQVASAISNPNVRLRF